jgi:hypothetical protein
MKEMRGDIWSIHQSGEWIGVTTNGQVKSNGDAVMGRGIALAAAQRFPQLPSQLGYKIKESGNHVYFFLSSRIVTIPTKDDWRDKSSMELIERSCTELKTFCAGRVYIPHLGCSNGGLVWEDVKERIAPILSPDWFIAVHNMDLA